MDIPSMKVNLIQRLTHVSDISILERIKEVLDEEIINHGVVKHE